MGVKIVYGLDEDNMPDKNQDKTKFRYYVKHILRINFVNEENGKVLFTWVPRLEDEKIIIKALEVMRAYDENKKVFAGFVKSNLLEGVEK